MRVRCVGIVNTRDEPVEYSRSLRIGEEYVVLEISATLGQRIDVRITSDDDTYSLWPIEIFEVVRPSLPSNWVAKIEGKRLRICPESWSRPGFWEDYFNGDRDAVGQFEAERNRIIEQG